MRRGEADGRTVLRGADVEAEEVGAPLAQLFAGVAVGLPARGHLLGERRARNGKRQSITTVLAGFDGRLLEAVDGARQSRPVGASLALHHHESKHLGYVSHKADHEGVWRAFRKGQGAANARRRPKSPAHRERHPLSSEEKKRFKRQTVCC